MKMNGQKKIKKTYNYDCKCQFVQEGNSHVFDIGILLIAVPSTRKRVKETDKIICGVESPHTD
jgi:hypothetical protein